MQNFYSVMRVLLLAAMVFMSYLGLALISFQDFVWELVIADNAESGQQVFYILPWLMLALLPLTPLVGMLVAMRAWYLKKLWRKGLAALALLALLALTGKVTSQWAEQRDVSFRPWKPAPDQEVLAAGDRANDGASEATVDVGSRLTIDGSSDAAFQDSIKKIKASLPSEESRAFEEAIETTELVLEGAAREALSGKSAHDVISEAQALVSLAEGARYSVAVDRHNQVRDAYLRFHKAMERLDAELSNFSEVLRERVETGRLGISDAESVQEKWKELKSLLDDSVKPRYDHFESQVDRLMSIDETNLSQNQQWLANYAKEAAEAAVWVEGHAGAVDAEIARVQELINR